MKIINIHIMKKMYGADINTVSAEVLSEDDDCLYTVLIDGVKFGINTAKKLKEKDNILSPIFCGNHSFLTIMEKINDFLR